MEIDSRPDHRVLFKGFELNLHTRELYKRGLRIRLHGQPIDVLALLVANPAEMVTRETLQKALWPGHTFVDFEHSLNSTINRLREALGDDAESPRYIETIPRLGYRFIAPVSTPAVARGARVDSPAGPDSEPRERTVAGARNHVASWPALNRIGVPVETRIRLAVLPFTNLSDEPQDHFSHGLSTQMIVQLGHTYKHLSVIGPVSSLYFTGGIHSFPRIAQELRADYLLVGEMWRVPPSLRVFTQLIRAADQCCVWSESYTREDADILAVLDLITCDISHGLLQALPQLRALEASLTTTPENYDKYLRARFFSYKFNQSSFEKAMGLFEQVLSRDPNFAPAHAELAHMLTAAMMFGGPPPQVFYERIEHHATKALKSWEESAEAHSALGFIRAAQANWAAGESRFLRAIEINPSFSFAYVGHSKILSALGRHEQALLVARQACELDPLSPVVHATLGLAQYHAEQPEEAIVSQERSIEIDPGFLPANATLSFIYETIGELEKAINSARTAVQHAPDTPLMRCILARSLAIACQTDEAALLLRELLQIRKANCIPATYFALIYAALGQREEAWIWLQRSVTELDPWRVFVAVDPRFRFFASDPGFSDLLKEIGLPHKMAAV